MVKMLVEIAVQNSYKDGIISSSNSIRKRETTKKKSYRSAKSDDEE